MSFLTEKGLSKQIIDYITTPHNFYDLLVLIEAHVSLGNLEICDTLLREWSTKSYSSETDSCLSYLSGLVFIQHHSFMQAEKILVDLVDTIPKFDQFDLLPKTLLSLANLYHQMFAYDQSLSYVRKILDLLHQQQSTSSYFVAHAYQQLGNTYFALGNLDQALVNFLLSLKEFELFENNSARASVTNNIAMVYHYKGSIHEAIKHYQLSLDIIDIVQHNKRTIAMIYNNLGNLYHVQGNYSLSLDCHAKSLSIREELHNIPLIAMSYNNLGSIYHDLGLFKQALAYQNKSLQLLESTPKPIELVLVIVDKCRTLFELDIDLESAKVLVKFEKEIQNETNESVIAYKSIILALINQQKKKFEKAIEFWSVPLQVQTLPYHYKIISYEGIIECDLELWLLNKSLKLKEIITQRLDNWYNLCSMNNFSASLCKIYLLRSKLALANGDLDEAQNILRDCISQGNLWGLPRHVALAKKILKEIDEKFTSIYDLIPQNKTKFEITQLDDFKSYLKSIHQILKEE